MTKVRGTVERLLVVADNAMRNLESKEEVQNLLGLDDDDNAGNW